MPPRSPRRVLIQILTRLTRNFALRHLREGGCILAEQVGLGKTIEAGLVIAQRRAEGSQRISTRDLALVLNPIGPDRFRHAFENAYRAPGIILSSWVKEWRRRDRRKPATDGARGWPGGWGG